jgi:hypothetical protein
MVEWQSVLAAQSPPDLACHPKGAEAPRCYHPVDKMTRNESSNHTSDQIRTRVDSDIVAAALPSYV